MAYAIILQDDDEKARLFGDLVRVAVSEQVDARSAGSRVVARCVLVAEFHNGPLGLLAVLTQSDRNCRQEDTQIARRP